MKPSLSQTNQSREQLLPRPGTSRRHLPPGKLGFYLGLSLPLFILSFKWTRGQSLCEIVPLSLPSQSAHCHFPRCTNQQLSIETIRKAGTQTPRYFLRYSSFYEQMPVRNYFPAFSILLTFQQPDFHKLRA